MDILEALESDGPTERVGKCLFQKKLDSIPEGTPGREALMATVESPDWASPRIGKVMMKLGLGVGLSCIRAHRSHTCPCYIGA